MIRDKGGFTLSELLMVVAIVAILATIAYPSYQEQIRAARRTEGTGLLLETAQALEKCKALYGSYNSANCATVARITGGNSIPSTEGFYHVNATAGPAASTFRLQALPQFRDPKCGILTLDQAGIRTASGTITVPEECW